MFRPKKWSDFVKVLNQTYIDLAIAVSYGKKIPQIFLSNVPFGGINLHPSLLPRYRGPSPLQYAILNDDAVTGSTVQSIHPTIFDAGRILHQIEIPIEPKQTEAQLRQRMSVIGANQLLEVVRQRLFEDPSYQLEPKYEPSETAKIESEDAEIFLGKHTSHDIETKWRALGHVYCFHPYITQKKRKRFRIHKKRLIFDKIKVLDSWPKELTETGSFILETEGSRAPVTNEFITPKYILKTIDGAISIEKVKTEGHNFQGPREFGLSFKKRGGKSKQFIVSDSAITAEVDAENEEFEKQRRK